jgi:hypothetical protein
MVLALVGTNLETFGAVWAGNWELFKQIVYNALFAIGDAILTTAGNMVAAGEAIVNGIITGIQNMAGALASAAVSAAQGAVAGVQAALGIQSPSTVFAAIGQNMMAGMAQGIDGAASMPAQASANAAMSTVSTVNNYTLNMQNFGGSPSVPDLFAQQAQANAGAW